MFKQSNIHSTVRSIWENWWYADNAWDLQHPRICNAPCWRSTNARAQINSPAHVREVIVIRLPFSKLICARCEACGKSAIVLAFRETHDANSTTHAVVFFIAATSAFTPQQEWPFRRSQNTRLLISRRIVAFGAFPHFRYSKPYSFFN